jgi:small subunit ribosomal protein S17
MAKIFTGTVRSDKMTKTVSVEVERTWQHPIYKKRVKRTKRYLAHNEIGAKLGDKVNMIEVRPLSRLKRWQVTEIIKK